MDRKFQSDEQWYVSPLLDLKNVKEDLLECRQSAEDTLYREISDDSEKESEKEKDNGLWTENLIMSARVSEEQATEAVEEVSNLDMFLEGPSDICTRTLSDLKGNQGFLKTSTLYTHQSVRNRDELIQSSRHRKSAYVTSLKYDKYIVSNRDDTNLYRPQCSAKSECDNDIVLTVDALQPYNRMLHPSELRSSRLLRPMGKFLVRGDTLLFDLRQKLCCQSDTIVPLENGEELNPMNLDFCTAEKFPSAFIFIHDTFYVDSSSPHAKDISFPIRNFMQQKEIFDPVEATKMDDIRIVDLKLRLGQPYLFQHSGNCEHLLVFHDLRLLHESDPHGLEKYPFTLYEKTNDRKCEVCKKSHVEFVVEQHELLPNPYTYFCRACFQEFNYVHGIKTHAFRAWPYTELMNRERRGWPFDEPEPDL